MYETSYCNGLKRVRDRERKKEKKPIFGIAS